MNINQKNEGGYVGLAPDKAKLNFIIRNDNGDDDDVSDVHWVLFKPDKFLI